MPLPLATTIASRSEVRALAGRDPGIGHRRRALLCGVAATLASYAVLASGAVRGPVAVALLLALLLTVPTSPDLSRRLALNGSLLIGWVSVLWWVRWPVPVVHAAVVVAAAVGWLAWRLGAADQPRMALRGLRPRVRRADVLLPMTAGAGLAATWTWAFPGSPQRALVALLPGVDNVAHFEMFSTIRHYGATTRTLGRSPDGSVWGYNEYPQGFHSLVATISELVHPRLAAGPASVSAYTQCVSLVVVLGVVVLAAAVVSLPGLRQRPLVAAPVLVFTCAAFLWKPGQNLLADGFANFWLAAAAVAICLVLALAPQRPLALPETAAVSGLLVFVAHAWAPLVVLAVPAVLALVHPLRTTLLDRSLRTRLWLSAGLLTLAALGVLKALVGLVHDVAVTAVVTASGGIHGSNPAPTFALLVTALYVCPAAPALLRGRGIGGECMAAARRSRSLTLAALAGLLVAVLLLVAQLRTLGTSSYYFLKFVMGFELVMAAFVPAVCGLLVASVLPPVRRRTWALLATGVATVAASQAFGAFPRTPVPLLDAGRPGTASLEPPYSAERLAAGILSAVDSSGSRVSFERDYVALSPDGAGQAFFADAWFHAILASGTTRASTRLEVLGTKALGVDDATPLVRRLLSRDQGLEVIVSPTYVESLRQRLGTPALASRVITWGEDSAP